MKIKMILFIGILAWALISSANAAQSVILDPSAASCTAGSNHGTGTCSLSSLTAFLLSETVTFTSSTAGPVATFNVSGSVSGNLGTVHSGSLQTVVDSFGFQRFSVTLSDGGTSYNIGDTFSVVTTSGTALSQATFNLLTLPQICANGCSLGTASSANKLTVSSNTMTNLSGLTRLAGSLLYSTDLNNLYFDSGTSLLSAGASVVVAKSASYAIADNDGYGTFLITTGSSSDVALTLPTPANNVNRTIRAKKVDSGTKKIVWTPHASETIDGASSKNIVTQNEISSLTTDGTNWYVVDHQGLDQFIGTYTIGVTGSTSDPTVTSSTSRYWRHGDTMEIVSEIVINAGAVGSGYYKLGLPSNTTIDTSRCTVVSAWTNGNTQPTGGTIVGISQYDGNGGSVAALSAGSVYVFSSSAMVLSYPAQDSSSATQLTRNVGYGSSEASGNNHIKVHMFVPITEWAL